MTGIGDLQALFSATQKTATHEAGAGAAVAATQQQRTQSASSTTDQSLVGVDRSVVSATGGSLVAALAQSDVRADKVARLQTAIANGTYNVSSSDVAESLIASLLGGPVSGRS